MAIAQTQRFLVGTVISQTFTAFFSKILPFGGFALIGFVPSLIFLAGYFYFIFNFVNFGGFPGIGEPGPAFNPDDIDAFAWIWIAAAIFVDVIASIATTAIWLAATSYGTFQYLRGQPVRFWDSLRRGVSVVLPCIGATALIFLGMLVTGVIVFWGLYELVNEVVAFLAMIPLAVVFAIIFIRLWVTVPAIAVERPGVFAALQRSWDLTRGHAWRVLGIILVMWAGTVGVSLVAGVVVIFAMIGLGGMTGMIVGQSVNIVVSLLANALYAIAAAVAYVELRRAKEGFGIEDIAAVFD